MSSLETLTLTLDEFEAIRLADLEGLYHERAADEMNVSRQTFGRIIESARKKIAEALIGGKALEIKGGKIEISTQRDFRCRACEHQWSVPFGTGRPSACPQCQSTNIHRVFGEGGPGRPGNWGRGGVCGRRMRHGHGAGRRPPSVGREGGAQ